MVNARFSAAPAPSATASAATIENPRELRMSPSKQGCDSRSGGELRLRLLPRGFELVAGPPGGEGRRIGDLHPQVEEELGVLHRPREVPVLTQLVRGLVVVLRLVRLLLLPAPARRTADHLRSRLEV